MKRRAIVIIVVLLVALGFGASWLVFDVFGFEFDESVDFRPFEAEHLEAVQGIDDATEPKGVATRRPVDTVPDEPETTGWIEGRVVDVDGRGIPNPAIKLWARVPDAWYAYRDIVNELDPADGRFRFPVEVEDAPTPHVARMRFGHALYATVERTQLAYARRVNDIGDVVLGRAGALRGEVVDPRGQPIAGAKVHVTDVARLRLPVESTGPWSLTRRHTVEASAAGQFLMVGIAPSRIRLWAKTEGRSWGWTGPFEMHAGQEGYDIRIVCADEVATDYVRGRLLGPGDVPIKRARVEFQLVHRDYPDRTYSSGSSTNDDGEFQVGPSLWIEGVSIDWSRVVTDVLTWDGRGHYERGLAKGIAFGTHDLVLRVRPQRRVRIVPLDGDDNPIEGFAIEVMPQGEPGREQSNFADPADGTHDIGLPDEPFTIEVVATGFETTRVSFARATDCPDTVELRLEPKALIRGRVIANGEGVAGAKVFLRRPARQTTGWTNNGFLSDRFYSRVTETVSQDDGSFGIDWPDKPENDFYVHAQKRGFAPTDAGPFRRADVEPDPLVLELTAGGALEGRLNVPDPAAFLGSAVWTSRGDGDFRITPLEADGTYRFDRLQPGRYLVERRDEPWTGGVQGSTTNEPPPESLPWDVEVEAGATARFDLRPTQPTSISVRLSLDGAAAADLSGRLEQRGRRFFARGTGPGSLSIEAPHAGEYLLRVSCPLGDSGGTLTLTSEVFLPAGANVFELDLPLAGPIAGDVDAPADRVQLLTYSWSAAPHMFPQIENELRATATFPLARGVEQFTIGPVPAGRGRLEHRIATATLDTEDTSLGDFDLDPGEAAQVR